MPHHLPTRCRYFLRKLRKVKKANGQILACNEVGPPVEEEAQGGRWLVLLVGGALPRCNLCSPARLPWACAQRAAQRPCVSGRKAWASENQGTQGQLRCWLGAS